MRRKITWLVLSCLVVVAMVLGSCGPAVPKEEAPKAEAPKVEAPKYGGTINFVQEFAIEGWDYAVAGRVAQEDRRGSLMTNEHVVGHDWAKGPAGTGETTLQESQQGIQFWSGRIAESFEFPTNNSIILQIRKGIHWALNPESEASKLVGGRELTADDVVYNYKRFLTSPEGWHGSEPALCDAMTVEKTGDWEVTIKFPVNPWTAILMCFNSPSFPILPPEVIEKYGNMSDWRNSVGTGAWIVTDVAPESSATFKRNLNYWMKDPVGPGKGNQLPYADEVNIYTVPDLSTRIAAVRTGEADWISEILYEDMQNLVKDSPQLLHNRFFTDSPFCIMMRQDIPEKPYHDKMVRQALMMAIDFDSIVNKYYSGEAEKLNWPIPDSTGFGDAYVPFEDLPANVQELYSYNPEKAKQFLTEAGYPDGFKTEIICPNSANYIDPLSIVKAQWAEVNVDVTIQPLESAAYSTLRRARSHQEMLFGYTPGPHCYINMVATRGVSGSNSSFIDDPPGSDPVVEECFQEMQKYILIDMPKTAQLYRELMPYLLEKAYVVPMPAPYLYTFWQPWIKNYHGELHAVNDNAFAGWVQYVWLDQDLKKEMTGK